jgi:hypothetical protein
MVSEARLKSCSYHVIRYVPHSEREEFLNIGLLLYCAEDQFLDCLITRDFRGVKRLHPHADLEFLKAIQDHFERQIQEHEDNLVGFLHEMRSSFSHLIQLSPERPVLAAEPAQQLQVLFERMVGERDATPIAADTRMRIKHRLVEILRHAQVFDHPSFEKHIPAARLTHPGHPFHFDFGYRPRMIEGKPNGHLKLIHALSLHRDFELASVLSLTMGYIRANQAAELTAIVDALPAKADKTATHTARVLEDARITLLPISEADAFAKSIHRELSAGSPRGN